MNLYLETLISAIKVLLIISNILTLKRLHTSSRVKLVSNSVAGEIHLSGSEPLEGSKTTWCKSQEQAPVHGKGID